MSNYGFFSKATTVLLFIILLGVILIVARDFLYPLFISVLLAYLLYPLTRLLENWHVPRILAILLSLLLAIGVFTGVGYLLFKQLSIFADDFPALRDQAMHNIYELEQYISRTFGVELGHEQHWLRDSVVDFFALSGDFLTGVLSATTSTIIRIGILPVYIFMLLFYRTKFRTFILRLLPPDRHPEANMIMEETSHVTKRFMTGIVTVVLILCFVNTTGLMLLGVRYALLFGLLTAFMNFIPYLGTLIGATIPLLFTLLIDGKPDKALAVAILYLGINFVENNILTPNITGGQVQINPFFTIISVIGGGMLWGMPGMIVAIPLLGMLKVYCDHVPGLQPYAYLLSTDGTEEHGLSLAKVRNFWKRLRGE